MMFLSCRHLRLALSCTTAAAGLICFGALAQPALAQTNDQISVNLVNLLVKQGVITRDAAAKLLKEASAPAAMPAKAQTPAAPETLPAPANGATRVQYVPPSVKDEIRADLKKEVIDQAKAENWARPNEIPAWTKRITISGDLRFRNEWDLYNKANDPELINFAAINANGPVDLNPNTNPGGIPFVNDTKNRYNQLSVRARLDIAADVSQWVSADLRLGTGQTNTPVSMTQILGGGLTKKTIWLD